MEKQEVLLEMQHVLTINRKNALEIAACAHDKAEGANGKADKSCMCETIKIKCSNDGLCETNKLI